MNDPGWTALGKSEDILPEIEDDSIDALICDPPGAISFMGKIWDSDRGGREKWVPWLTEIIRECYRTMRPGAYGLVWALPRKSHWTAWALEDAGFEIRDKICHVFFSGFPKNHNASKAIDKRLGAEREVVGQRQFGNSSLNRESRVEQGYRPSLTALTEASYAVTTSASPEAQQWDGWGTAMKPAMEEWILVRKPMKLTVAENLLTHGVGALNLGACEIGRDQNDVPGWHQSGANGSGGFQGSDTFKIHDMTPEEIQARRNGKGRHPSHLIFSHSPDCEEIGAERIKGCPAVVTQGGQDGGGYDPGCQVTRMRRSQFEGYGDTEGMETVSVWQCVDGCPVAELNRQSGQSKSRKGKPRKSKQAGEGWGMTATGAEYDDFGGKSRFFYCPKPSRGEKQQGLLGVVACAKCGQMGTKEHIDLQTGNSAPCLLNDHPTPKSVILLRYFCKLVCPPGGIILDPFMGSGSVGVAAILEGFRFIGIEQDERSHLISCARLKWATEQSK